MPARPPAARVQAAAHFERGVAALAADRLADAAAAFRAAVACDDTLAEAHVNLGYLAQRERRLDAAAASYLRATALRPRLVPAHFNLGNVLNDGGRPDEAALAYETVLALDPAHLAARVNLSVVRLKQNRPEAAEQLVREALALQPDYVEARINLGNILMFQHRLAESVAATQRALELAPGHPQAHVNLGYARFMAGDLHAGWPEYEYRQALAPDSAKRVPRRSAWLGREPVAGRSILLHSDAGMGDAIQFSRYAPLLAARGARVRLELPRALLPLYAGHAYLAGLRAVEEPPEETELHCPLTSLPLAFDTGLESIPPPVALTVPAAAGERWRRLLGPARRPRVGVVWAGSPKHRADHNRSMPFTVFRELLDGVGEVEFYSVQNEVRERDAAPLAASPVVNLAPHGIGGFDDTAAIIAAMDLVITVDTAIGHLAASLGRPVWLLLSYFPDWRWMLGREDTPWYPTMRLFRQTRPGDWPEVLRRVRAGLPAGAVRRGP